MIRNKKCNANDTDDNNVDRDIPYMSVLLCRRYNKGFIAHTNMYFEALNDKLLYETVLLSTLNTHSKLYNQEYGQFSHWY